MIYFFEFIVFVQWFLYCWIRDSWTPYDQEVSVASLTLPDNLMRRLMRTGTVKGEHGQLMTSGLNESDLIARPVRWWLSIGTRLVEAGTWTCFQLENENYPSNMQLVTWRLCDLKWANGTFRWASSFAKIYHEVWEQTHLALTSNWARYYHFPYYWTTSN